MKPNFINIILCDNDYGSELDRAASLIQYSFGHDDLLCSEERVKEVVIDLVVALNNLKEAYKGFASDTVWVRQYLNEKLKVTFKVPKPGVDHDGGSVCIDRANNYIWRY